MILHYIFYSGWLIAWQLIFASWTCHTRHWTTSSGRLIFYKLITHLLFYCLSILIFLSAFTYTFLLEKMSNILCAFDIFRIHKFAWYLSRYVFAHFFAIYSLSNNIVWLYFLFMSLFLCDVLDYFISDSDLIIIILNWRTIRIALRLVTGMREWSICVDDSRLILFGEPHKFSIIVNYEYVGNKYQ